MQEVDLSRYDEFFFDMALFVILEEPTGVLYTNQVGGTACLNPEVEGFLVPLTGWEPDYNDPMLDRVSVGNYPLDPNAMHRMFERLEVASLFDLRHDLDTEELVAEAWIPVRVRPGDHILKDFAGQKAILTYTNSD